MRAMVLDAAGRPLHRADVPTPEPQSGQLAVEVEACGICRTDLHILDGELDRPKLPLIPGHQIVGRVVSLGDGAEGFAVGERVGIPWLGWTCGQCEACRRGNENLCDDARFTGYHIDGGLAESCVADARYAFRLPDSLGAAQAAPLLCAGLIGYRSFRLAGEDARRIGLYGFGAAAHILTQVASGRGVEIYAFTRPGDLETQNFARRLGAVWAGGSDERAPVLLDAAILLAPVGALVPVALQAVRKGGSVVCGGIHMSDIPSFPYSALWGERSLRSVANLTREDARQFLELAPRVPVRTTVHEYRLEDANRALDDLRRGRFDGAAVVLP